MDGVYPELSGRSYGSGICDNISEIREVPVVSSSHS
jgi:hypothetical protein